MTPEQERLARAREQVAASTGSPPTGIAPNKPPPPRPSKRNTRRQEEAQQPTRVLFRFYFAALLGAFIGSLILLAVWAFWAGFVFVVRWIIG